MRTRQYCIYGRCEMTGFTLRWMTFAFFFFNKILFLPLYNKNIRLFGPNICLDSVQKPPTKNKNEQTNERDA